MLAYSLVSGGSSELQYLAELYMLSYCYGRKLVHNLVQLGNGNTHSGKIKSYSIVISLDPGHGDQNRSVMDHPLLVLLDFFCFGSNLIILCIFVCLLVCILSRVVKEDAMEDKPDAMSALHAAQEKPIKVAIGGGCHGPSSPTLAVMCCFPGRDETSLLFSSTRRIPCPWVQIGRAHV